MAKTPHGTKGWIDYMVGAREYYEKHGTLNGYEFYKWNGQRWYPDNKSKVIKDQKFNPDRRIGSNLYSPKSYESKLKEISDRRSWHLQGRFTEEDYLDYAKKHNYPESKGKQLFKQMQADLKKDKDLIGKYMHDDHINAISLDEGFEHPRNKVILDAETNLRKSAMRLDDTTQEALGTFKTKEGFLKADFEGVPLKGNLEKQKIVTEYVDRVKTPDKVRAIANKVGQRAYKTGSYRVGGVLKATTGLSRGESLLRIIGGDYVGGSLGLAMTTPTFQKKAAALLAKQGIKLIPGVSLGSGALQAAGYVAKGQFTKAGLSAIGGVLGELGPAGDAAQAAIDLGLTASDMKVGKKAKLKTKVPDEDDLFETLRRTGKFIDRYGI